MIRSYWKTPSSVSIYFELQVVVEIVRFGEYAIFLLLDAVCWDFSVWFASNFFSRGSESRLDILSVAFLYLLWFWEMLCNQRSVEANPRCIISVFNCFQPSWFGWKSCSRMIKTQTLWPCFHIVSVQQFISGWLFAIGEKWSWLFVHYNRFCVLILHICY